jgi:hypothetical protein
MHMHERLERERAAYYDAIGEHDAARRVLLDLQEWQMRRELRKETIMATSTVDWTTVPIPQSNADLYANYGDPTSPTFEDEFITTTPHNLADGTQINVQSHISMVPALHAIFEAARQYIKDYGGCYVVRDVRGATNLSAHSWGLAIDVNVADNPLGATPNQPAELVTIFESHDFFWGGNYHTRKDGMHFERTRDFI